MLNYLPRPRVARTVGLSAMIALGLGASVVLADGGGSGAGAPANNDSQVLSGPKASDAPTTAPSTSFAGERGKNPPVEMLRRILDGLNLTEDQKGQVKTAITDFREAKMAWEKENGPKLKSLREQAQAARQAKTIDQAKDLEGQAKTLAETNPKPRELILKVRAILTADQQTTYDQKIQELVAEMKDRRMDMRDRKASKGPTSQPSTGGGGTQLNL